MARITADDLNDVIEKACETLEAIKESLESEIVGIGGAIEDLEHKRETLEHNVRAIDKRISELSDKQVFDLTDEFVLPPWPEVPYGAPLMEAR